MIPVCSLPAPDYKGRGGWTCRARPPRSRGCIQPLPTALPTQAALCGPPERALPLHFAAAGNHVGALETLFRYAVAAQPGGFRVAQQVLLRADGSGMPALHTAVLHGAVDGARRLLQLVFPFDTRGPAGRTALHLAALRGSTVMVSMLLRHSTPAQVGLGVLGGKGTGVTAHHTLRAWARGLGVQDLVRVRVSLCPRLGCCMALKLFNPLLRSFPHRGSSYQSCLHLP